MIVDRRPLRVSVIGSSMAPVVAPFNQPRSVRPYPDLLRRSRTTNGTDIEVADFSAENADIRHAIDVWQTAVQQRSPDVVVVHLGTAESFAGCTPVRVWYEACKSERHHGVADRVVNRLRPALWKTVTRYQQLVDPKLGLRGGRMSPDRFEAELRTFIRLARRVSSPLVLLIDTIPVHRYLRYHPAAHERHLVLQQRIEHVVASLDDPDVRRIPLGRLVVEELGVDAGCPDGFHLDREGHRGAARLLLEEISAWERRHLRPVLGAAS